MDIEDITSDRKKLLAAGLSLALVAAVGGVLIGQSMAPAGTEGAEAEGEEHGEEEEQGPEGFVAMTPARLEASGIRVMRIEQGSIASEILAQATVTAPPDGQALLTARADGAVVRISKRLGDFVRAGETVALLESREAAAFVAERNAASARAQAARSAAARERRLYAEKITARQDLEAAEAARAEAEAELQRTQTAIQAAGVIDGRYLAVRSPISGRIACRW